MNLKNTIFPVEEIPAVGQLFGEGIKEQTGYKFIVRKDTGNVLSCVTDKYKVVQNQSIIEAAEPVLKETGAILTEAESFSNGARSTWTWKIPDIKVKIDKKDHVNPTITLKNSYDGSVQLHILAGAFRLICSNGAVIGIVASKYKNKHIQSNISLDDFESVISETMDKTKLIFKEEFPVLQGTNFKDKHIIDFLKMFPIQANEMVTQSLIANRPKSFWDLFNVGTNVLSHHMNRNAQSTHGIEGRLYPSIKKWAEKEAKVAIA